MESLSFLEALQMGGMMFLFVFAILALLFVLIIVFSKIMGLFNRRPAKATAGAGAAPALSAAPQPASPAPSAPAPAQAPPETPEGSAWGGSLTLKKVDEKTAALIMAIISDQSGIPLSQLCFKSIALVEKQEEA